MSRYPQGSLHPLTLLANEAYSLFSSLGFEITSGPELETAWYNFDALNVPKDHPARDMQDTFYIKKAKSAPEFSRSGEPTRGPENSGADEADQYVLRTHATNTTARILEKAAKEGLSEYASISIGKVFRNEATDITHEMQFFQIDGCMIGENINLSHMKAVLIEFYKKALGSDVEIEFRPSFFPFTEPSVEVHAKFNLPTGQAGGKWLEMMGGGMIHPEVLRNAGLDPEKIQGFAFGGGLDRIAMIRWNVPDVRLFYQGDLRLNQF
ncbi:MAG: phenylalanine--tRNA ligase subunit alpha [Patescibacteria group bacterium]